jgi:hypothetical protein
MSETAKATKEGAGWDEYGLSRASLEQRDKMIKQGGDPILDASGWATRGKATSLLSSPFDNNSKPDIL